jgi:hypothetical protein
VLSDAKARKYYDKTGSTEGIDVSAQDFLSTFYGMMQESLGGFTVQVRRVAAGAGLPAAAARASAARRRRPGLCTPRAVPRVAAACRGALPAARCRTCWRA